MAIVAFLVLPLWYLLATKKASYYQGMWGLWRQLIDQANPGP